MATTDRPAATSPLIDATRLRELLARPDRGGVTVLDVRYRLGGPPGAEEFARGHVPGSSYVDLDTALAAPVRGDRVGGRHPVPDADVFVTNLRPVTLEQWGLDPASLTARFPSLVVATLTGFGDRGPDRDRPSYDMGGYWARTGAAMAHAVNGEPPLLRGAYGDHTTSMALVAGINAALLERERTGRGRHVSTSLLRAGMYTLGQDFTYLKRIGRWFPFGRREVPPSDRLGRRVAAFLTAPNDARDRVTDGIYKTPCANNPVGRMNAVLPDVISAEPVERKFLKAAKSGELSGYDYAAQLADAQAKGAITSAEAALLKRVRDASFEFISVDDFDAADLAAGRHSRPSLRSVA